MPFDLFRRPHRLSSLRLFLPVLLSSTYLLRFLAGHDPILRRMLAPMNVSFAIRFPTNFPTSFPNPFWTDFEPPSEPQINKKSIKNPSKINLGGVPGGPWRLLAANTEKERGDSVFWDPLGAVLAAFWAVLAASWGRLGGLGGL